MTTFGNKLRQARETRGLSQPALAALCGWTSQSRISNYEQDEREPKLRDIEKIARALKIPMASLMPDDDSDHLLAEKPLDFAEYLEQFIEDFGRAIGSATEYQKRRAVRRIEEALRILGVSVETTPSVLPENNKGAELHITDTKARQLQNRTGSPSDQEEIDMPKSSE